MLCMTLKAKGGWKYEIHMLNPGEHYPLFGGSSRGLYAGKTASLIVSASSPNATTDTEYDIHNPTVWAWIAKLINEGKGEVEAVTPEPEAVKKRAKKKA